MKFDLITPCKNCPFRTDATAIRFSCRERAEEIEETAYRYGFPCHLSAVNTGEDDKGNENENGGYEFKRDGSTQHCAGAMIMYMKVDELNVPLENVPDRKMRQIWRRVDFKAPVYEGSDAFLDSYNEKV